jgi:hypothetical protein
MSTRLRLPKVGDGHVFSFFEVGAVESLTLGPLLYDAVVSELVLNFIPNGSQALSPMRRVTNPGSVIATYVWDYASEMQLLRYVWDAVAALDSDAAVLDEGGRFPLCMPERLKDLFVAEKFNNVDVRSIDVQAHFADFEDFWRPFLPGQ